MEEYRIIQRLKQGDIDSLRILVDRYQEKAIRTAYLITQERALAEDVVQSTFIRLYKNLDTFDTARPFEPYFMRSVVNASIRASRKQQRLISLDHFHEETGYLDSLVAKTLSPEEAVTQQESSEELELLLQKLSPEKRAVIVMKYYLGYSESEIAEAVQAPKGTVKSRLYQARQQLKRLLKTTRHDSLLKEDFA